jgi:hypothetical protein
MSKSFDTLCKLQLFKGPIILTLAGTGMDIHSQGLTYSVKLPFKRFFKNFILVTFYGTKSFCLEKKDQVLKLMKNEIIF